ncbi:MAG: 2-C-methyl-D-erythritol 4-phosphate cytidylyltransferase [Pseudomonadota bacterium]|nr:2-C-methyl-D-erythritol 4-phosphate cytidylyltransferase [Pseudomonadota bacterium]
MTRYWAIVPAAGRGRRFGGETPKQYLMLQTQTVMQHSLNRLCQGLPLAACIVPISADDQLAEQLEYQYAAHIRFVAGGTERMDSVWAGMQALQGQADEMDWVLVHDVARPCIALSSLKQLLIELADDPVGGLLAVPVRDTLKRAQAGRVACTVSREALWQGQTPQMFRYGVLYAALQSAIQSGQLVTDEASAVELAGHSVRLVEGRSDNIKITYPDDLPLAAAILVAQAAE